VTRIAEWRGVGWDEWMYLALVATVPVMQPFHVDVAGHTVVLTDALFVAASAGLLVSLLVGRRRVRWSSWHVCLACYLATAAASTILSDDVRRSAVKLTGIADLVGLAFLTTAFVGSAPALRRACTAWLAGLAITVAAAITGIGLFAAGVTGPRNVFLYSFGSLPPGPYPRVMALFLNANMLCSYLAAAVTILLAARAAGWIARRAFVILFAGSLVTAAASLSPGLGGMALALAIWYAARLRPDRPGVSRLALAAGWVGAVLMFVAVTISPVGLSARTIAEARLEPSSRVMTWTSAWRTFRAHPWLGRGPGLEAADVTYVDAAGITEALTDAHQAWLSILAQQGIAGLVAFVAVLWPVAKRPSPLVVTGEPLAVVRTGLYLAVIGGFLYASLAGSFESTRHVWLLFGLTIATASLTPGRSTPDARMVERA
jgi:O-antigen ligase